MRRLALAVALVAGMAPGAVRAQDAGAAIRGVISDQISALRADDFAAAFTFASPGIQRLFGTPERFGAMVRSGYPMVWRPAEVRFGGLTVRGERRVQSVLVTDGAGTLHVLDYEMVAGENGWRINGVRVRPADTGA